MKMTVKTGDKGFTLVEMLLVLTVISAIMYGMITYLQQRTVQTQIDKTSVQMQQILSAALAYYVANGNWPGVVDNVAAIPCLQATVAAASTCQNPYLPFSPNNPWNLQYNAAPVGPSGTMFAVWTAIPSSVNMPTSGSTIATIIMGTLPLAYTSGDPGTATTPPAQGTVCATTASKGSSPSVAPCNVVAAVNIPAQNLNTAMAVNFAGLYHHGGCVPVPTCPSGMTAQVMIVPVSVSGVNDSSPSTNAYPISSFTGYATAPSSDPPPACDPAGASSAPVYCSGLASQPLPGTFWRACIQVVTEKGDVSTTNTNSNPPWGANETLMAITRCAMTSEPAGSTFGVYSQ